MNDIDRQEKNKKKLEERIRKLETPPVSTVYYWWPGQAHSTYQWWWCPSCP